MRYEIAFSDVHRGMNYFLGDLRYWNDRTKNGETEDMVGGG